MKAMTFQQKFMAAFFVLIMLIGTIAAPAQAYWRNQGYGGGYYGNGYCGGFTQCHPYVTHAAVGAGVGALAGGLIGRDGSGIVKGALIGGAAGTGYEYVRQHGLFGHYW